MTKLQWKGKGRIFGVSAMLVLAGLLGGCQSWGNCVRTGLEPYQREVCDRYSNGICQSRHYETGQRTVCLEYDNTKKK